MISTFRRWVHYTFNRSWTPNIRSNQYCFVCIMFHVFLCKFWRKMCQNVPDLELETNNNMGSLERYTVRHAGDCMSHWLLQHGAALQWPLHGAGLCRNQAGSTSQPADGAGRRVLMPRLLATRCFVTSYFMHDVSIFFLIYHGRLCNCFPLLLCCIICIAC